MEKGILCDIRYSKKGNLVGRVVFEDQKDMSVPPKTKLSEAYEGRECQILRENGIIQCILIDGQKIYDIKRSFGDKKDKKIKKHGQNKESTLLKNQPARDDKEREFATAPYNFVSLNDLVVEGQEIPRFDTYIHEVDRFTGYIDYDLETLTPFYMRDTYTDDEFNEKNHGKGDNPNFFSPGGEVKIPGSSLRGMTRTLVEIVSWSKFTFFDDYRLYYHAIAGDPSLECDYKKIMVDSTVYAGYITQENDGSYSIIPAKKDKNKNQFYQVKREKFGIKSDEQFMFEKQDNKKYLVVPGNIDGKVKRVWLINPPDKSAKTISLSDEDIKMYKFDFNRYEDVTNKDDADKRDGNLLRWLSVSEDNIAPCFYTKWKDSRGKDRIIFGHTRFFRMPYKYKIGEYIPKEIQNPDIVDMAECIFGRQSDEQSNIASRVFFEDAKIIEGQQDIFYDKKVPCTLATPNPTTFQHYLKQDEDADVELLKSWNSSPEETIIRGHKLYWHRKNKDWSKETVHAHTDIKRTDTIIKAVKPNTKFKGKIRFENLTSEELGALLFVLNLPKHCCHKLGMGKPLGLGSVRITPKLFIIDREKRYRELFDGDMWELAEKEEDIDEFKNVFEEHMMKQLFDEEKRGNNGLWGTSRLKQLELIFDWENTNAKNWIERTQYMELKDFEGRPVLPGPHDV